MDQHEAEAFARQWIAEWNARDVEAVLTHFADDVEFRSPLIVTVMGNPDGCVRGKDELRTYWTKALANIPDLRFELADVLVGAGVVAISYRNHGRTSLEVAELGADGKIVRGQAAYGAPVS